MFQPIQSLQQGQIKKGATRVLKMYLKQKGRCPYTGLVLMPFIEKGQISEDHVVPQSQGGISALPNLVLTPVWVNQMKGNMSKKEFMKFLKENGLPYKKSLRDYLL